MNSGTKMTRIGEALDHYGLGDRAVSHDKREAIYIIAEMGKLTQKTMNCQPIDRKGELGMVREFMREECVTDHYSPTRALIELPSQYLLHYWLVDYVLTVEEIEEYRQRAAKYNPPRLPVGEVKEVEKVGSVRI